MPRTKNPFDTLMETLSPALDAGQGANAEQVRVLLGEIKRLKKALALVKISRLRAKLLSE